VDALHKAAELVKSSCLFYYCKVKLWHGRSSFSLNFACTEPILSSVSRLRSGFSGAAVDISVLRISPWAPRFRTVQGISSNLMVNTLLQLRPCWYACYNLLAKLWYTTLPNSGNNCMITFSFCTHCKWWFQVYHKGGRVDALFFGPWF
jgi:hypothetical protein